ncbi:preprotein translocase subunit YajC [Microbacterium azadirachtae]|jgi:preprotein translocase subunit YajC|uniref:Preprotein translocase subunit YajC n=1 Tax=Microbacterium azadirachtae TaxID=582680 RepID=A0A1I6FZD0_9MICO|nr:preprotein translocase subunit YajC [Microbacterium azadirachtae]SFR35298.1 preprotein translocase subunit YajC [Microbacterium azadirachtae]
MNIATFFSQYGLFFVLAILLVFMVLSTRRRNKRMKEEQEKKAKETVPGAKVLLQGGLYGTIVEFDADNLDRPAKVEIAPGVVIEVHSQAILRIVDEDQSAPVDEVAHTPLDEQTPLDERAKDITIESAEETRARLERDADDKN